jgi:hypothetical protein
MPHNFFISHYSGDKNVAEIFATSLRRITLQQIIPWFSSETLGNGGLKPGMLWFEQILGQISSSKAIVTLLTPNSINRPWIYFESGIGCALKDCNVIPVCIGIKRSDILPPLGLYQCYQLNDYRSLTEFFSALLRLFDVQFDEEVFKPVLQKMVSDISQISFENEEIDKVKLLTFESLLQDLKGHIDKRFIDILEKPPYIINGNGLKMNIENNTTQPNVKEEYISSYSVLFKVNIDKFKNDLYIDIRENDSFQDLTNNLYFMLSDHVSAFSYLEQWVIVDQETGNHVVIREIASLIPAKAIFKPESEWYINKLDKPYRATDSRERIRKFQDRI